MNQQNNEDKKGCKSCSFWREWGVPMMVVLFVLCLILGYISLDFSVSMKACNFVAVEWRDKFYALNDTLLLNNKDIDSVFIKKNYLEFCNVKGYKSGYLTQFCNENGGIYCYTNYEENELQISESACFNISELITYVSNK